MPKLNPLSAKKVIKKLESAGFVKTHQRGSHVYLKNADKIVTVPLHGGNKDVPIGTLHNIVVKQASLSIEKFNNL